VGRENLSFDDEESELFEYGASHAFDDEPPDLEDITAELNPEYNLDD